MATVNFLYRSKRPQAPLNIRLLFRVDKDDYVIGSKTKLIVEKTYWKKKHSTNSKVPLIRNKQVEVNSELQRIENHVLNALQKTDLSVVDKKWLTQQINEYYNPPKARNTPNGTVTYWMDKIVEDAHLRENAKGGIGIGKSRINSYNRLKKLFLEFQGDNTFQVKDIDKLKFESFKKWLLGKKTYSPTYVYKKVADLKTVCIEARANGVLTSPELNDIKTKTISAYDDDMDVIVLTNSDIDKIEKAHLIKDAHINARKWLILACYTGQRGQALTKRIIAENFHRYGENYIIQIKQIKGNKKVTIPVLPKVREIYESGLPYTVSTQKLNKHFKEVGEIANVNNLVMGRKQDKNTKRGVKKLRPKYEYISTHIGRRTFASNHYGQLPTAIIMKVTGHSKESTLLTYINKADDTHVDVFFDYYNTLPSEEIRQSSLKVIKNDTAS
ncbi:Phage integrase family protein [Pricia antarctica]|uniref:Phage integrase family protein n=1 Tax=Pricia antarctica TaxID=641691 RepID=A0A1G7JF81_9FLAO|nr:phage integrase SAM-like domain-containing protein [Pricia antarctica]SDF23576.1 Phage integrase family protein [Pricia antarctica]